MSEEVKNYIENTDFNKYKLVVDREYKEQYIQGLEQENQQLKERNENQFNDLMKRIHSNNDKHLEESNKLIKENFQLKEVIEEVREYINIQKHKSYSSLREKAMICNKYHELLQILDKVKEVK